MALVARDALVILSTSPLRRLFMGRIMKHSLIKRNLKRSYLVEIKSPLQGNRLSGALEALSVDFTISSNR